MNDDNSSVTSSSSVTSTTKITSGKGSAVNLKNPVQVQRRNARERNRVRQVNQGFITLRDTIPTAVKSKKLSKVDTLRSAAAYIKHLREILTSLPPVDSDSSSHNSSAYNCRIPHFTDAMVASVQSAQFGHQNHFSQPTINPDFLPIQTDSFNYLSCTNNISTQLEPPYYPSSDSINYASHQAYYTDVKQPGMFNPTTSPNSSCLSDSSYDYDNNLAVTPFTPYQDRSSGY